MPKSKILQRLEHAANILQNITRQNMPEFYSSLLPEVGRPLLIKPYQSSKTIGSFWRVPILSAKYSRVIGFFDIRNFDCNPIQLIRTSPIPRRNIKTENDVLLLPKDITELSKQDINKQIRLNFGDEIDLLSDPELMFEKSETRIVWKVSVKKENSFFDVLVTPGFAYKSNKSSFDFFKKY